MRLQRHMRERQAAQFAADKIGHRTQQPADQRSLRHQQRNQAVNKQRQGDEIERAIEGRDRLDQPSPPLAIFFRGFQMVRHAETHDSTGDLVSADDEREPFENAEAGARL